jgi:hypothetical protein
VSLTPDADVHGPVDFVLLEFPRDRMTGEAADALMDLVDGEIEVLELTDPGGPAAAFSYFAGARSGLLGDEDIQEASSALEPDTVAALLVYENAWAAPFVAAARRNGGELVASARIPATDIMSAVEALETAS